MAGEGLEGTPMSAERVDQGKNVSPEAEVASSQEMDSSPQQDEIGQARRKSFMTTFTSLLKGAVGVVRGTPRVVKGAPGAIGGFAKDTTKDTAANIASGKGPATLNPLGHPAGFISQEPSSTSQTQTSEPSKS